MSIPHLFQLYCKKFEANTLIEAIEESLSSDKLLYYHLGVKFISDSKSFSEERLSTSHPELAEWLENNVFDLIGLKASTCITYNVVNIWLNTILENCKHICKETGISGFPEFKESFTQILIGNLFLRLLQQLEHQADSEHKLTIVYQTLFSKGNIHKHNFLLTNNQEETEFHLEALSLSEIKDAFVILCNFIADTTSTMVITE